MLSRFCSFEVQPLGNYIAINQLKEVTKSQNHIHVAIAYVYNVILIIKLCMN